MIRPDKRETILRRAIIGPTFATHRHSRGISGSHVILECG